MSAKLRNWMEKMSTARGLDQAGFTLTEMLIVISLIAIVMTLVVQNFMRKFELAKVDATKIQIRQLGVVLDDFKRVCGWYPTEQEGLQALVTAPQDKPCKNYDPEGFLKDKKVPKDAWGNDFYYTSDGSKYVLKSFGADGKEGGDDVNKDISSDNLDD